MKEKSKIISISLKAERGKRQGQVSAHCAARQCTYYSAHPVTRGVLLFLHYRPGAEPKKG